jgi:hypothetical protein
MSDLKLPGEEKKKKDTSFARVAIWIVVGGVGAYTLATGIIGIVNGGS